MKNKNKEENKVDIYLAIAIVLTLAIILVLLLIIPYLREPSINDKCYGNIILGEYLRFEGNCNIDLDKTLVIIPNEYMEQLIFVYENKKSGNIGQKGLDIYANEYTKLYEAYLESEE